jgi:hypothetical protein
MDVRGEIYDPGFIQYSGEISKPETFKVIPDVESKDYVWRRPRSGEQSNLQLLESLILAQDERWRRA